MTTTNTTSTTTHQSTATNINAVADQIKNDTTTNNNYDY